MSSIKTPRDNRYPVNYTAKNINSASGSRTAINADLLPGAILVNDPYGHDQGKGCDFTQPQTSHLRGRRVVVSYANSAVNRIPSASAPTQRQGGGVDVADPKTTDIAEVLIDGSTLAAFAVGDYVLTQNGSFYGTLVAAGSVTAQNLLQAVGRIQETKPNNLTINGGTDAASQATVQTSAAHGLAVGDRIKITGGTPAALDTTWTVLEVPSTTTFKISNTSLLGAAPSAGTVFWFGRVKCALGAE